MMVAISLNSLQSLLGLSYDSTPCMKVLQCTRSSLRMA